MRGHDQPYTAYCSQLTAHRSLLTAHSLPLASLRLLTTDHCSPLYQCTSEILRNVHVPFQTFVPCPTSDRNMEAIENRKVNARLCPSPASFQKQFLRSVLGLVVGKCRRMQCVCMTNHIRSPHSQIGFCNTIRIQTTTFPDTFPVRNDQLEAFIGSQTARFKSTR